MKTQNIISTPDITGNIGSCGTNVVENMSAGFLFKNEYTVIMTNSCTGEIIKDYTYQSYSLLSSFGIALLMLLVFGILKMTMSSD